MSNAGRFAGKVVLVTGGARGMGEAHCRAFVEEGARVVLTDVLEKEGTSLAAELGKDALFLQHNVSSEEDWARVISATESRFGPVSILVNNAGIGAGSRLEDTKLADWQRVIDVNLTGVFLGMRAAIPGMKGAGGGAIVNISSIAGLMGAPYLPAYVASKFGVRGLTKSAALELGDFGIRVNSVHPGYIRTPILGPTKEEGTVQRDLAIKRFGRPEEVTRLVLFLASDESSYTTGSEFVIDGGWTAGGPIG